MILKTGPGRKTLQRGNDRTLLDRGVNPEPPVQGRTGTPTGPLPDPVVGNTTQDSTTTLPVNTSRGSTTGTTRRTNRHRRGTRLGRPYLPFLRDFDSQRTVTSGVTNIPRTPSHSPRSRRRTTLSVTTSIQNVVDNGGPCTWLSDNTDPVLLPTTETPNSLQPRFDHVTAGQKSPGSGLRETNHPEHERNPGERRRATGPNRKDEGEVAVRGGGGGPGDVVSGM